MLPSEYKCMDKWARLYTPAQEYGVFLNVEFENDELSAGLVAHIICDQPFILKKSQRCCTTQQLRVSIFRLLRENCNDTVESSSMRYSFTKIPAGFVEQCIAQSCIGNDDILEHPLQ